MKKMTEYFNQDFILIVIVNKMSTYSVAKVISDGSQIQDYFEEEKDRIERKKLKMMSKESIDP